MTMPTRAKFASALAREPTDGLVEAAAERVYQAYLDEDGVYDLPSWSQLSEEEKDGSRRDARAALRTMPLQEHADGWRPIETAPKDGTQIIYKCANTGEISSCSWQADDCGFDWYDIGGDQIARPLRWIPLPAPMVAEDQTSGAK